MPSPRFSSQINSVRTGSRGGGEQIVTWETVEAVSGGKCVIQGVQVPIMGDLHPKIGDVVLVAWRHGRPHMVLQNEFRRGLPVPTGGGGGGIVEELFIDSQLKDVWFRNDQQIRALKLTAYLAGAARANVGWGLSPDSFWLSVGDWQAPNMNFVIYVFQLNRKTTEVYGVRAPKPLLMRTWHPADVGTFRLSTIQFDGSITGVWGPTTLLGPDPMTNAVNIQWSDSLDVEFQDIWTKGLVKVISIVLDENLDLNVMIQTDIEALRSFGPTIYPRSDASHLQDLSTPPIGGTFAGGVFPHPPWADGSSQYWHLDDILDAVHMSKRPGPNFYEAWRIDKQTKDHYFLLNVTSNPKTLLWRTMRDPFIMRRPHIFRDGIIDVGNYIYDIPGSSKTYASESVGLCSKLTGFAYIFVTGTEVTFQHEHRSIGEGAEDTDRVPTPGQTNRNSIDSANMVPFVTDSVETIVSKYGTKLVGSITATVTVTATYTGFEVEVYKVSYSGQQAVDVMNLGPDDVMKYGCPDSNPRSITPYISPFTGASWINSSVGVSVFVVGCDMAHHRTIRTHRWELSTIRPDYVGVAKTSKNQPVQKGHVYMGGSKQAIGNNIVYADGTAGSFVISDGSGFSRTIYFSSTGDSVSGGEIDVDPKDVYAVAIRQLAVTGLEYLGLVQFYSINTIDPVQLEFLPSNEYHIHWTSKGSDIFIQQLQGAGSPKQVGSNASEYVSRRFYIIRPDEMYQTENKKEQFIAAWDPKTGKPTLTQPTNGKYPIKPSLALNGRLAPLPNTLTPLQDPQYTTARDTASFQAIADSTVGVTLKRG